MEADKEFTARISESIKMIGEVISKIGQEIETYASSLETASKTKKKAVTKKKVAEKKAAPAKKIKDTKKKSRRVTAPDVVLEILQSEKKGVNIAFLKEKTGFDSRKISNSLYRLKKQGAIKSVKRGVYTSL